jgi:hypothetical protein
LDRTHGCQRPGATSLATPIIWSDAMRFIFLWGYVGDEKVPEHGKYGSKDKHATRCWQTEAGRRDVYHSNAEKLKLLQIYALR